MGTFWLEFWTEQDDFCIYAEADAYEKELTLEGQAKAIMAQFATIYDILEDKRKAQAEALETAIQMLSERLIAPFADQIRACDLVRLVAYEDVIRCAFDLLLFDGRYLFLQRPVCYQLDEGACAEQPEIELGSALLIADLTADPEQACREVATLIPDAEYHEVGDAKLGMIEAAAAEVDALVISAHGDLDAKNMGALYLKDDAALRPALIEQMEAWVVYFDSCQQGVNVAYLQAFQEESDTQYYLAPIISNDAGDSSTKTLVWFFTGVLGHKNPIRGLFETRKRLYEHYRVEKQLDLVTSLNKAFPFRLYEFVESEEAE
jgi:hypothetical protein